MNRAAKIIVILFILLIGAVGSTYYFYKKYTEAQITGNQGTSEEEVQALVEKIGRLVVLPEGEIPTVATVADPSTLADQPFFADAQEGDKVLVYQIAQKAVLYNPTLDKVVNIATITLTETDQTPLPPGPVIEEETSIETEGEVNLDGTE
ncbi:MAG: hypothetical protein AAB458_02145 [Patescibacteria group bacterium]